MQISHLSKRYANSQKLAVDDISFEVNEGEVFGTRPLSTAEYLRTNHHNS